MNRNRFLSPLFTGAPWAAAITLTVAHAIVLALVLA